MFHPPPPLGDNVPRRGNLVSRGVGRSLLALLRWRFERSIPDVPKCVLIVAPHTSNWDFVVGVGAMLALGLRVQWLGKHTLFRWPFAGLLRWLGGIPVDRHAAGGVVERAVGLFRSSERLFVAVAPEGTRRRVERWKSGFHRIAQDAAVPILIVSFDYRVRTVGLGPLFVPTGDFAADLREIRSHFTSAMAKNPEAYA